MYIEVTLKYAPKRIDAGIVYVHVSVSIPKSFAFCTYICVLYRTVLYLPWTLNVTDAGTNRKLELPITE